MSSTRLSSLFPTYVLGHPHTQNQTLQDVPQIEQKRRPPKKRLQDLPLIGTLPQYSGPYDVGIIELEIPVNNPRTFGHLSRHHIPLLSLETVLLAIYYPATIQTGSAWRPRWLHPPSPMSRAYGRFSCLPEWPTMAFFMFTTWKSKIRAYEGARLAENWPLDGNLDEARIIKGIPGDPPPGAPSKPVFPLVMFSHGLGGSRLVYSALCGEYASHGFVVCALEHRDGSGARTIVNHDPRRTSKGVPHFKERNGYHLVDFIFPQKDKHDTSPRHEVDGELRAAQIKMRLAELKEAYQVMVQIEAGQGLQLAKQSIRRKGSLHRPPLPPDAIDWQAWKGRFSTVQVTLAGHSFGSATVVEALRQNDGFDYVSQAVIYDLWGIPLQEVDQRAEHSIRVPLLFVMSEAFMYWSANVNATNRICEEVRKSGAPSFLMTIRGTVHISISDFCLLYSHLATLLLKTTMGSVRAIDVAIDASLEFVAKFLSLGEQPFHRYLSPKKLLDLPCVDQLPTEHKPAEMWTAIRLHVSHEARKRVLYGRKRYWKKLKVDGQEEVWLHMKPDPTQVDPRMAVTVEEE